ncbi:hypothetical protein BpHYR1_049851 [Brachionus plicatilis]|uniref:Uncharacterized protein n=1 Tax=Brachionus plicatilis TaxID=10195 RepID=A0A3M7Q4G4_BRAPC|nr:hypothetical protein BpHYR1_049851 [Brachionus plicatilis]
MLNHQKYIGSEIKISKTEWSLKGMKKKINSDSLKNWKGNVAGYNHTFSPLNCKRCLGSNIQGAY